MENTTLSIFAIIALLGANGFYVAAEFSLVKAKGIRIESLANDGHASAKLIVHIQRNLEAYLATCQLGITMASLGLGWVGEPAVAAILEPLFTRMGVPEAMLHTIAFIGGFLIFSSLHIVVGEQVPKTLAIRKAEPVSLWVAYPLQISYLVTYPLNWLLNTATRSLLSLINVEEATHADVYSDAELKGLVATSGEHGQLGSAKAEMLRNLFEFDQRQVGRIMIPLATIKLLDVSADPDDNLSHIRDSGHSRFPVIDSENNHEIVGIVIAKDIYTAMLRDDPKPWANLRNYCRPPLVVPEAQKVSHLFDTMRANRAHMALVVDEYGDLTGIITLEDLLEEIVGDIEDETDAHSPVYNIVQIEEGRWEADGLVSLADAERAIGLVVPSDLDANTLSGFCVSSLGQMPEAGDTFAEYGFQFTVQSVENHRVGRLLIEDQSDSAVNPESGTTIETIEKDDS